MSKPAVGDVYSKVIEEVCAQSRVDFEESGVEHGTLDLLKSLWQRKLSQLNVAQLPWDPKPEPAQPTVQNNTKPTVPVPSNGHVNSPAPNQTTPAPPVKQEPQAYPAQQPTDSVAYPPPQFPQGAPMNAQQRAAMHLHQRYGNQAGPQIAQLQQQHAQARAPMQPGSQQPAGTFVKREENGSDLIDTPDFKMEPGQAVPVKASQTDGSADDYQAEVAQRRAAIAIHREEGDRLMRNHFIAAQQELEAGGLLRPLESRQLPTTRPGPSNSSAPGASNLHQAQGDAAADDVDDEDAINSDLDDPDELENADEQEENVHEVMLCTYDKVQRVKNKWKCTLKDGILRVDQQEYVFHKGQGEFEW